MMHHDKIKEFNKYLADEFSEKMLEYQYDINRGAAVFTLHSEQKQVSITVPGQFFEENKVGEIEKKLQDFRLKEFIRHGRSKQITVTKFGLKLEDL